MSLPQTSEGNTRFPSSDSGIGSKLVTNVTGYLQSVQYIGGIPSAALSAGDKLP